MKKSEKIWKKPRFAHLVFFILPLMAAAAFARGPIIIDHNCTDLGRIPDYWLDQAKTHTFHYAHTSHGEQITLGLDALEKLDPKYSMAIREDSATAAPPPAETPPALRIYDGNPPVTYVEPQDYWATQTGLTNTGNVLDTGLFDASMWAWCGQLSWYEPTQVGQYLNAMNQLEADYPGVTFIYMTGHLDGGGETLARNNGDIRDYTRQNNKVLYDFADIETYDPAGVPYPAGSDACDWCGDWCTNNPDDCTGLPASGDWGHTHPFNSLNKAKAFWWMMARLAGWNSECADFHPDTGTIHIPYLDVGGESYWVDFTLNGGAFDFSGGGPSKGEGNTAAFTGGMVQISCLALDPSGATYWLNLKPTAGAWNIDTGGPN